MLRYMRKLSDRDLALDRAMIPLGSCTMKLNATTRDDPADLAGIRQPASVRARANRPRGYHALFERLEKWLCDITGYDAVSLQPNSGAQGEYAGLLAIRAYHAARGEAASQRLPDPRPPPTAPIRRPPAWPAWKSWWSPATRGGNVDVDDLRAKAEQHRQHLAAIMITYPSTHGVFEEHIREICDIVHAPWRTGLYGRRQHERAGRAVAARRLRRRCLPPQPAQDLLHSPRRRRPGHGPDRRQGASGAVPARSSRSRRRCARVRPGRCRPRRAARRRS